MIKENQKAINRITMLIDLITLVLSFLLAWYIRISSGIMESGEWHLSFKEFLIPFLIMIPIYIIIYDFNRLYNSERMMFLSNEIWNIVVSNFIGIIIFVGVLFVSKQIHYSRKLLLIFYITSTLLTCIERIIFRKIIRKLRKNGYNKKYTIFIGYSSSTDKFYDLIKKNKHWGYSVCGIFDDYKEDYEELKYLGKIKLLEDYLEANREVEEIIITLEIKEYDKLKEIIEVCEKMGVRAQIIPSYTKYFPAKPYVEEIGGIPLINLRYIPLDNIVNRFVKRAVDVIGSLIALLLASPIILIVALLIKLTSKGDIIFKQERIGLNKKPFIMYKFRSMKMQNPEDEKKNWTVKNDSRKTKIGTFIRKTSIDELPQFFNVLKGDMSLIGPRPERPQYVEKFKDEIPKYMVKHQVRPGITGWAQVNGWRGDTSIEKRIECDIYYIENWSFMFDIKIIILTFVKGFVNKNAY